MNDKEKCQSVYNRCREISPINPSSWDELRNMIELIQGVTQKHNIIMYNNDLRICMNGTWNKTGNDNGSKANFKISKDRLRDTALHLSSKISIN